MTCEQSLKEQEGAAEVGEGCSPGRGAQPEQRLWAGPSLVALRGQRRLLVWCAVRGEVGELLQRAILTLSLPLILFHFINLFISAY